MKKLGIMQPYFLPYIGYFQLVNMVDEFVLYDNIQFTKKGWIHRNRVLQNGSAEYISLPLKKDSDYLDVAERFISDTFEQEKNKLLRKIESNYKKAPQFNVFFPIIESVFQCKDDNLFLFIFNSIKIINKYLEIDTPVIISSDLSKGLKSLKSQDKVIAICKERDADIYINSSGGLELYNIDDFKNEEIKLQFFKSKTIEYPQFNNDFVPFLSILDVCMFSSKKDIQNYLQEYELIIPN